MTGKFAESSETSAMRCYAVPYGTVGFLSHCFHLYLGYCILRRLTPLWPARRLAYVKYDMYLAFLWFAGLVALNTVNVLDNRCEGTTQSEVRIVALEHLSLALLDTLLLALSFNKRAPIIGPAWLAAALDITGKAPAHVRNLLDLFSVNPTALMGPGEKEKGGELGPEVAPREPQHPHPRKQTFDSTFFRDYSIALPLVSIPCALYTFSVVQKSEGWVAGGPIRTVTVLYGVLGCLIFAWSLGGFYSIRRRGNVAGAWAIIWYGSDLLAALIVSYSTWALASSANDVLGFATGKEYPVIRYWAYFAVSKLPIFMV